ncbi:MAG: 5-formyltetrahydrofolate cyclo-ligase [Bacteroidales bacterium]|nr:5-formyltetrahydrofolate cyclo-ligase [Bacteroidales bacterium]
MNLLQLLLDRWFSRNHRPKKIFKEELRAILGQKRKMLPKDVVAQCSAEVVDKLLAVKEFQTAERIMIYYPVHNEIDLRDLKQQSSGKHFYMPVIHRNRIEVREYTGDDNLQKGKFGIPEPQTPPFDGKLDLILVPGVAFSLQGERLGRGGGYYDRFLSHRRCCKIGVSYQFQLLDKLPVRWHDVRMDKVIVSSSK